MFKRTFLTDMIFHTSVQPRKHPLLAKVLADLSIYCMLPSCDCSEQLLILYNTLKSLIHIPKGEHSGVVKVSRKTRALHYLLNLKDREGQYHLFTCEYTCTMHGSITGHNPACYSFRVHSFLVLPDLIVCSSLVLV